MLLSTVERIFDLETSEEKKSSLITSVPQVTSPKSHHIGPKVVDDGDEVVLARACRAINVQSMCQEGAGSRSTKGTALCLKWT